MRNPGAGARGALSPARRSHARIQIDALSRDHHLNAFPNEAILKTYQLKLFRYYTHGNSRPRRFMSHKTLITGNNVSSIALGYILLF